MSESQSDDETGSGGEAPCPDPQRPEVSDEESQESSPEQGLKKRPARKEKLPWELIKTWNLSETSRQDVEEELNTIMQNELKADISGMKV